MAKRPKRRGKGSYRTGDNQGKNNFIPTRCIIGVDQSYTNTGLAIAVDGKLKKLTAVNFKGCKNKTEKRNKLEATIRKALEVCIKKYTAEQVTIFVERIRTFTAGDDLRPGVIKPQAALIAKIVDAAYEYGIKVYSIDTRAWKTAVLGTSRPAGFPYKGVDNPQKIREVKFICELGFDKELEVLTKTGQFKCYDDDIADAACIALYGFHGGPYKLLLET